jgi:hypothetical protein
MGATPTPIIVTSNQTEFCCGQLSATIMDHFPIVNITPFGACKASKKACNPVTPMPWTPGSSTNDIQNLPNLRDCDMLVCTVGGMISVQFGGQTQAKSISTQKTAPDGAALPLGDNHF